MIQKTKIDWATHSWNPLTGCLGPNNDGQTCPYCYAARIAKRWAGGKAFPDGFAPTFHPERVGPSVLRSVPAGSRVFVGSMTDLGAPWAAEYLALILEAVKERPDVTFIFLTKQPEGFANIAWPANCWVGMTYTGQGSRHPDPSYIPLKWHTRATVRFVSIEPLLGPVLFNWRYGDLPGRPAWFNWIILGAQSGPGAVKPQREWIATWEEIANKHHIPLFMKLNLRPYWDGEWRQEFPEVTRC